MMLIFNIHDNQQIKLILWTDQEVTHIHNNEYLHESPHLHTYARMWIHSEH